MIRRENAKPGTRDWMLTNTYIDPDTWWRSPRIEGYCSEMSVSAGDTLKIMVSTNPRCPSSAWKSSARVTMAAPAGVP